MPDQEATTIAQKLVDEFFCRFSVPSGLHSDQGKQFESKVISAICQLLQIDKSRTTPYHPQSDGLVEQLRLEERFNCTLTDMLATTAKEHPLSGKGTYRRQTYSFAYNTSVHASTGQTLFPDAWATSTVAFGPSFQNRCETTDDNSRVRC